MRQPTDLIHRGNVMKTIAKALVGLAVLIAILIFYVIFSFIYSARNVEVNDSDLIYSPQKIEDSRNVYLVLLPVLKQIKEQKDFNQIEAMIKDKKITDYKKVSQLLNQHSSFFSTFSKSLELNSLQVPIQKNFFESDTEMYTKELNLLHKLELLKIKMLMHEGKMKAASQEILKLFKYGYLLQNSDGGLIYAMTGILAKDRALNLMQEWVAKSNLDSAYYKEFIGNLEKYADNQGIANSLKIEYTVIANSLTDLVEQSPKGNQENKEILEKYRKNPKGMKYLYNENATINKVAEYFRQEIKNLNGLYANIEHKKIHKPSNRFAFYLNLLSGNPIGKLLLQIITPRFDRIIEKKFELDTKFNLTKLSLALKAYHTDAKSLPNSLNELMPNYVSKIPKDPYDDKQLKYSKSKKIIYSVYSDMKDNQGDIDKDLRIELNFD